jgi:hypothetical protein
MDKHLVAQRLLTSWSDLLGDHLPISLKDAADALEASQWAQPPHAGFEPAKATPQNIEDKIIELAGVVAAEEAFTEARNRATNALGHWVLNTAVEVLPQALEVIEPRFEAAAAAFSEALSLLPDNPTSDALVNSGPAAVEAFQRAKSAELDLDAVDRWVASLSGLFGGRPEPVLRCLTPTTREGLQALLQAHDRKSGALKPLWVAGATTPDVSWTINPPDKAREIRSVLDSLPATEYKRPAFLRWA